MRTRWVLVASHARIKKVWTKAHRIRKDKGSEVKELGEMCLIVGRVSLASSQVREWEHLSCRERIVVSSSICKAAIHRARALQHKTLEMNDQHQNEWFNLEMVEKKQQDDLWYDWQWPTHCLVLRCHHGKTVLDNCLPSFINCASDKSHAHQHLLWLLVWWMRNKFSISVMSQFESGSQTQPGWSSLSLPAGRTRQTHPHPGSLLSPNYSHFKLHI